ncbi:hypothetical protein EDB83DRAFT_2319706 [Lactarius deliciosus]|nr:hypothetical protein EDB83DRAFT_2319706 [Lactarius deliciosus]
MVPTAGPICHSISRHSPPLPFAARKPVATNSSLRHADVCCHRCHATACMILYSAICHVKTLPRCHEFTACKSLHTPPRHGTGTLQYNGDQHPDFFFCLAITLHLKHVKVPAVAARYLQACGRHHHRNRLNQATHRDTGLLLQEPVIHSHYRTPSPHSSPVATPPQHGMSRNSSPTTVTMTCHASQHRVQDPVTPPQHGRPMPRCNRNPLHTSQYNTQGPLDRKPTATPQHGKPRHATTPAPDRYPTCQPNRKLVATPPRTSPEQAPRRHRWQQ